jgi:hypothetical protein
MGPRYMTEIFIDTKEKPQKSILAIIAATALNRAVME